MNNSIVKTGAMFLLFVSCFSGARAWHEYQPMIVEGRVWDCGTNSFAVKGDTIIDGLPCKKVMTFVTAEPDNAWKYVGAAHEHDRKVDIIYKDNTEPVRLYDFSLGYYDNQGLIIFNASNIVINGQERRYMDIAKPIITVDSAMTFRYMEIIEGVGTLHSSPFNRPWYDSHGGVAKCYDGDEVLFSNHDEEFYDAMYDGVIYRVYDGEINGDGVVDIADVNAVISMMLHKNRRPEWDDAAANMSRDDTLDIADVNAIINLMLGK